MCVVLAPVSEGLDADRHHGHEAFIREGMVTTKQEVELVKT